MTILVFPGQGSQYLGMAKDFYEKFDTAKNVFKLIEDSTNINVKEIIFEDNNNLLNITISEISLGNIDTRPSLLRSWS